MKNGKVALGIGLLFALGEIGTLGGEQKITVVPDPLVEIGEVEGDEGYLFEAIGYADRLADGRVVVADVGIPALRVFGPRGNFLAEVARRGRGPGEVRQINGMWLTRGGGIGVWDAETRRITIFDANGEVQGISRVRVGRSIPGNLEGFIGSFRNGDVALAGIAFGGPPSRITVTPDRWVLARFSPGGELRNVLDEAHGVRRFGGSPIPFSAMVYASTYGDSVYLSDGYEATVRIVNRTGSEDGRIRLPEVELSSDRAWADLEVELNRRGESLFLQLLERVPRDAEMPQIAGLLVDTLGLLWVKVYEPVVDAIWLRDGLLRPGAGGEWRVVRPNGEVLSIVQIPARLSPVRITESHLLGVREDALGVETVVIHRIERGGS